LWQAAAVAVQAAVITQAVVVVLVDLGLRLHYQFLDQ
jgi:hypothetical protein